MRKLMAALTVFLLVLGSQAETVTVAQDHAVDSDVVLESAVREIKSAPRDTVNVIGDGVKYVTDEAVTAAKGVAAAFKSDPVENAEKAGMIDVADAWDSSNDILFRSYQVTDAVGDELLAGTEAAPGDVVDVRGFFTGIDFPKHTSVYYRPDFNRLFVRHTLADILAIEDVLAEQHSAVREMLGQQVEIETKFVEVNQSTLNELGFNWNFDSKYGGNANIFENLSLSADSDLLIQALRTAGGITATPAIDAFLGNKTVAFDSALNNSDTLELVKDLGSLRWTLVINALEQSDDADVLSAPRIVTRDGSRASITVGEERMVAKEFEVGSSESSLFIENDLDKEIMGVHLEVTPEIRGDDLLDLELKPKVIDLIGYENYNVHPDADMLSWSGEDAAGLILDNNESAWDPVKLLPFVDAENGAISLPALNGRVPYYRLREMETQVTVADGSTVGMGGLIYDKLETFRDKVPVLGSIPLVGRLFRSEGEKSVKRNLMIFVTATQVDVNGRRNADLALKK